MYEIAPVITLGHILVIHSLYINNDFYNKLPPEDKKIFDEAAKRSAEDVWKMAAETDKKAVAEIVKGGGKVNTPSPEFKAALVAAGQGTWKLFTTRCRTPRKPRQRQAIQITGYSIAW